MNQYAIPHKLRWIETRTKFTGFWTDLIDDGSIILADRRQSANEIFTILNLVFEMVQVANKSNKYAREVTFSPLNKSKVYVPQKLLWTRSPKSFANHFKPFLTLNERCIFIDKYDVPELPSMIEVLTSLITIPKEKGTGTIDPNSLLTMVKSKDPK